MRFQHLGIVAVSGEEGRRHLGGNPVGVFGSDRWWAYSLIPTWLRQLCWAHLKRDLRQIVERTGPGEWVGRKGLRYHRQVIAL